MNICNVDWSQNEYDPSDPDTAMSTMGCRTLIGYDRHGMGYKKVGRGNVSPITLNLPKLGIKHGVCLGKRKKPDLKGFFEDLNEKLKLMEIGLVDRFYHICGQDVRSGLFMYQNGTMADSDVAMSKGVYEAMRHGTQAMGFIGLAECCQAMYGEDHTSKDKKVIDFSEKIIKTIHDFCADASERNNLNFSCYATPR